MTGMNPSTTNARDAGLARVARVNRWSIAGAIGMSVALSVVAEQAFHGRTVANAVVTRQSQASQSQASQPSFTPSPSAVTPAPQTGSGAGSGIQAPAQAPAPTPAAPVVVSGGS